MKEYRDTKMQVGFNAKTNEMIDAIKQKTGLQHTSEVIRMSILEFYRKFFKDYTPTGSLGSTTPGMDKDKICEDLDGEVIERNGAKICRYKTYEVINPDYCEEHTQEIPFSMLTRKNLEDQFSPNRAACREIILNEKKK